MATQSAAPHNPTDDAPSSTNSALQPTEQPTNDEQPTAEPPKEISLKSVFVNTQPIREEQVQNAVKFLSHPRVRGSPVVHRRNFLERKGLTKEEIDEAFRHNSVIPRLKSWIRRVVLDEEDAIEKRTAGEPRLAEEAAAAKIAAVAAVDVAKASQDVTPCPKGEDVPPPWKSKKEHPQGNLNFLTIINLLIGKRSGSS
ncbi:hypothetical protein Cgig2_030597 [Carnegiea gigantea]|uniref:Peroxisomal membrane protein PEX14 n=1 Tax=Carnegiea gigantea TaxID=171969 RepID=A0A9Q1GXN7_9CARY|nr:hypothetical protein Cgig2_030597 [Carnegiea gigantea]